MPRGDFLFLKFFFAEAEPEFTGTVNPLSNEACKMLGLIETFQLEPELMSKTRDKANIL